MKKVAYWSRENKFAARLLIACCHVLIICLACYAGIQLRTINVYIPNAIFGITACIFILVTILFSTTYSKLAFNAKKLLDSIVMICSFTMILVFANQKNVGNLSTYRTLNGSFAEPLKPQGSVAEPLAKQPEKTYKTTIRELKKQLKELKRLARDEKASATGVIIAIVVGLGLGILLTAASCSLACNNQGTLALFVLLGGLFGIFFVCRLIIRGFKKKNRENPAEPAIKNTTSS